jgi:hypothetical protein
MEHPFVSAAQSNVASADADSRICGASRSQEWGWVAHETVLEVMDLRSGQPLSVFDFGKDRKRFLQGRISNVCEVSFQEGNNFYLLVSLSLGNQSSILALFDSTIGNCVSVVQTPFGVCAMTGISTPLFFTLGCWEAIRTCQAIVGSHAGILVGVDLSTNADRKFFEFGSSASSFCELISGKPALLLVPTSLTWLSNSTSAVLAVGYNNGACALWGSPAQATMIGVGDDSPSGSVVSVVLVPRPDDGFAPFSIFLAQ